MQQNELAEFLKYVADITNATVGEKMKWDRANPSTYVYNAPPPADGRIVLQRMNPSVFSIQAVANNGDVRLEVHGTPATPPVLQSLTGLFMAIERTRDIKGLDFLKSIVPK